MNDITSTHGTSRGVVASTVDPPAQVVAFVGPSLRPGDLESLETLAEIRGVRLQLRPPVRRRDLLDLGGSGDGSTVAIIDGEFGQSLAVSISELRTVLQAGVRLHGASSMGALRAVECRTLGMTGSGWVYRQYLSGRIESDGEVALLYDPYDYTPVTIPLANVRWLIDEEIRMKNVTAALGAEAFELAGRIHFRERRPGVLSTEWRSHLPREAWQVLLPELADGRRDHWDRKRLDALETLREVVGS